MTFSKFVEDAAFDVTLYLQGNIAHCQVTVQKHVERLAGQGDVNCFHGGPPIGQ